MAATLLRGGTIAPSEGMRDGIGSNPYSLLRVWRAAGRLSQVGIGACSCDKNRAVLQILLLVLLTCLLAPASATAHGDTVRLAFLAPDGRIDMLRSWDALERHLRAALPEFRLTVQNIPHAALHETIARGEVDFFVANSGLFVEVEAIHGVSPLATLISPYAL